MFTSLFSFKSLIHVKTYNLFSPLALVYDYIWLPIDADPFIRVSSFFGFHLMKFTFAIIFVAHLILRRMTATLVWQYYHTTKLFRECYCFIKTIILIMNQHFTVQITHCWCMCLLTFFSRRIQIFHKLSLTLIWKRKQIFQSYSNNTYVSWHLSWTFCFFPLFLPSHPRFAWIQLAWIMCGTITFHCSCCFNALIIDKAIDRIQC